MKFLVCLTCTIIMSLSPAISQSNAELGVAAIGLVVSDIESSEKFYRDVLGMVEVGQFSLDAEWSKDAGAASNQQFSVKMFKLSNTDTATVLKLAYFEKTAKRPDMKGINVQSGVNYLTLYYSLEDFSAVLQRLDGAGIEKTGWVKREGYQLVFIKDPDGVFIEIVGPPDA